MTLEDANAQIKELTDQKVDMIRRRDRELEELDKSLNAAYDTWLKAWRQDRAGEWASLSAEARDGMADVR